jgi:hypothetical protein
MWWKWKEDIDFANLDIIQVIHVPPTPMVRKSINAEPG